MLWSIDSCQKGIFWPVSPTNKNIGGGGEGEEKKQTNKLEKREKKVKVEAEESLIINQNPLQDIRVQSGYNYINTYSHIVIFVF